MFPSNCDSIYFFCYICAYKVTYTYMCVVKIYSYLSVIFRI